MNQDSFFGFYPTVSGAFRVNDKVDATAYGSFWTTPSFGNGGGGSLWTEAGAGANLVNAANQNNFLHWWINGGVKLNSVVSAGLHYESLGSNPSGNLPSGSVYRRLGPYVQGTMGGFALRFSAGPDVQDRPRNDGTGSFYKLTPSYTFSN